MIRRASFTLSILPIALVIGVVAGIAQWMGWL